MKIEEKTVINKIYFFYQRTPNTVKVTYSIYKM